MRDSDLQANRSRHEQLRDIFNIHPVEPECQDEYVRIPLDLPWKHLENDVDRAYRKFGWYGMVHRRNHEWNRSQLYGGLGLTYNPDYVHDIDMHAQCLGEPRSSREVGLEEWTHQLKNGYEKQLVKYNTYNDPLGLRVRTEVTEWGNFPRVFEKLRFDMFQGRLAEVRPHNVDQEKFDTNKEFLWHVDEENEFVSRILIPLVYSDDYYIEFQDTGTKLRFEPGYAYHWNTKRVHRWNFDYHKDIQNRTCLIIGFSPWLTLKDGVWYTNEYTNKMNPTDMVKNGIVI